MFISVFITITAYRAIISGRTTERNHRGHASTFEAKDSMLAWVILSIDFDLSKYGEVLLVGWISFINLEACDLKHIS